MLPSPILLFVLIYLAFGISVIWVVLYRFRNVSQEYDMPFEHVLLRKFWAYLNSIIYGLGIFFVFLPIFLIGWYSTIEVNNIGWFSIAPWPFSMFSSLEDRIVLFVSLIGFGLAVAGISIGIRLLLVKEKMPPLRLFSGISLLRGVYTLSFLFPCLIEVYLAWLDTLPPEPDGPYSLAFSNLLKGPFPMSWFASGKFLLAMYMSAILFGIVIFILSETIREKSGESRTNEVV